MDYIFCARNQRGDSFGNEPGGVHFLKLPGNTVTPKRSHKMRKTDWIREVQAEAVWGQMNGEDCGDIVIYVHGFNNSMEAMVRRHRKIKEGLEANGFEGVVVSFDWPSADVALNYLEDRTDAKRTAIKLVDEGIASFARLQRPECMINMHLLAHSMGAFVVREAFDDADDRPRVAGTSWAVSQVLLVAADISQGSLAERSSKSSSLYRHCVRLTNYYTPQDNVLSISNAKRIGVSPRAGRIGLPDGAPEKAVNLYCGDYYGKNEDDFDGGLTKPHTWYFDDPVFMEDIAHTVAGKLDRHEIPTRAKTDRNNLALVKRT